MARTLAEVDERTHAIDHEAGNRAYKVMGWVLVLSLAVRAKWPELANWKGFPMDTMFALFAGCLTWSWTAWRNRIISRKHLRSLVMSVLVGAVAAVAMGWLLR